MVFISGVISIIFQKKKLCTCPNCVNFSPENVHFLFFIWWWVTALRAPSSCAYAYLSDSENWCTLGGSLCWKCLRMEWQTIQSTFSHTFKLMSLLPYPTNITPSEKFTFVNLCKLNFILNLVFSYSIYAHLHLYV